MSRDRRDFFARIAAAGAAFWASSARAQQPNGAQPPGVTFRSIHRTFPNFPIEVRPQINPDNQRFRDGKKEKDRKGSPHGADREKWSVRASDGEMLYRLPSLISFRGCLRY